MDIAAFGKFLKDTREHAQISVEQMADRCRKSPSMILEWERGNQHLVWINFQEISLSYGIGPKKLLTTYLEEEMRSILKRAIIPSKDWTLHIQVKDEISI